jgi:hypothetical protein
VVRQDSYYGEELHQTADFDAMDLTLIAKEKNAGELVKLIELIVGTAILCPEKYVTCQLSGLL